MAGAGVRDIVIEGPWQHLYIAANGIRFHVASGLSSAPDRPLLLLLHGFGEFWWAWRHQIPALDQAGFSVAAMDLRGYGASDKTPRGYDPQTTAADLAGVIRSIGYSQAVVVGHDWGGMAGWAAAAYAPGQVRGLVSIAAPHPLAYPWRAEPWQAASLLPLLPERRIMANHGAFIERLLRRRAAPGSDFPSAAEARYYRDALRLWPSPHCALEYQRTFLRNSLLASGRKYRRALRQPFVGPLLSIHGQQDPVLSVAAMAAAERYVQGPSHLVELPGAGHQPHEEAPAAVNAALLNWLGSLD